MNLPFAFGGEVQAGAAETGAFFNVGHVQHRVAPGGGQTRLEEGKNARLVQRARAISTTIPLGGMSQA